MRVAVAGGTGLVGRLVVAELAATGIEPVALARSLGVDLVSGAGLDGALTEVDTVVDVAGVTTASRRASIGFFGTAAANLLRAAERAGVRHVVTLSIVGADHVDVGYYLGKRRQEELLAAGPVPWTLLRATQFHEFAEQLLARVRGPVMPVPRMAARPVAAREVAAHLVQLATAAPAGVTTPLAGPRPVDVVDMVRAVLAARGQHRLVLPVRLPGGAGRAMATGGLLPAGLFVAGTVAFEQHLATLRRRG